MFEWLSGSTWGYPIIGAIHVLGIAWFGGLVLASDVFEPRLKWLGSGLMIVSGLFLFALHPVMYYSSVAFRIKVLLLLLMCSPVKLSRRVALTVWIVVIFASRGIAFF